VTVGLGTVGSTGTGLSVGRIIVEVGVTVGDGVAVNTGSGVTVGDGFSEATGFAASTQAVIKRASRLNISKGVIIFIFDKVIQWPAVSKGCKSWGHQLSVGKIQSFFQIGAEMPR